MSDGKQKIDAEKALAHLREQLTTNDQRSWDWNADLAFATAVGDDQAVKDLEQLLKSYAPFSRQIAFHEACLGHIKKARLKYLRQLVNLGEAQASWEGLGAGSKNEFGAGRVRVFSKT
jgi:hypothetical protein